MQLLLTSAGLSNRSIEKTLQNMMDKISLGQNLAYIPTAANVEVGNKSWMIDNLNQFIKAGFEVDIVDVSAIAKEKWLPRLEQASVIVCGGGNQLHLMYWVTQSGLQTELPKLLEKRIYVGISAGSIIAGPTVKNSVQNLFEEKYEINVKDGLHLTSFHTVPHYNSTYFSNIRIDKLRIAAMSLAESIYAIDDNSAVKIVDEKVEIISEGKYAILNDAHN